jgi:hypothetical protein
MEISGIKNKILKKETNGTVSGDYFENKLDTCSDVAENIPIDNHRNIPSDVLGQCDGNHYNNPIPHRRYTKSKCIQNLAINKYRQNGQGICFKDLLSNGLAKHKQQAQATLKHCLRSNILFTPYNRKPQQYYPTCLKSEILNRIIPVRAIGVGLPIPPLFQDKLLDKRSIGSNHDLDPAIIQTLEGYVLPLLSEVPLYIHKMHFKTRILPECYQEIVLLANPWNKGKEHEELIGRTLVRYRFYANGTVVVSTESSNNPFPLATEFDLGNFMSFLGQVRDRLVLFIADKHERVVPGIMDWELTQCDLNKDVHIERWVSQPLHLSIQVRHLSHLFRVYIKTKGGDTLCRVEESVTHKGKCVAEAINDVFNPTERLEKQIAQLDRKFDRLFWEADIFDSKILKQVGAETDVRSINEDVDVDDN